MNKLSQKSKCPIHLISTSFIPFIDYIQLYIKSILDNERITFKKGRKLLGLVDVSKRIPKIKQEDINNEYQRALALDKNNRILYIENFKTQEGFGSDEHMKYNQIMWILMEKIIEKLMSELIINNRGEYLLYAPEFSNEKWNEIISVSGNFDEINKKFIEDLFKFFFIKIILIYNDLEELEGEYNYSMIKNLIELYSEKDFFELFIYTGIYGSINNYDTIIKTIIMGLAKSNQKVNIENIKQCLSNSSDIIIDMSRSNTFMYSIIMNFEESFYFDSTKNKLLFSPKEKDYKKKGQTLLKKVSSKMRINSISYKSCPMLFSKSNIFGKNSNKIIDFSRILEMFFLEFHRRMGESGKFNKS